MMRDAESPRGSNPRSTSIIWTTLRIIRPQPTSSTSEPATSNAISALRRRRIERPSVATRASCRSAFVRPRPHAVSGARESATATSRLTTPTIARTVVSRVMPDAEGAGRPSCDSISGASVPSRKAVSATPSASAAPQMSDVSASSIRDDMPPGRAERQAHRHFPLPLHRPQQHQHGDVGADDDEHQSRRGRDAEQHRPQRPEPALAGRLQLDAAPVAGNRRRRGSPRRLGEPLFRGRRRNPLAQPHHVGPDRRGMRHHQIDRRAGVPAVVEVRARERRRCESSRRFLDGTPIRCAAIARSLPDSRQTDRARAHDR